MFLNEQQMIKLTGRRIKSKQIEWLRVEGIPFRVNATGHPVVTQQAVEGKREAETTAWRPRALEA